MADISAGSAPVRQPQVGEGWREKASGEYHIVVEIELLQNDSNIITAVSKNKVRHRRDDDFVDDYEYVNKGMQADQLWRPEHRLDANYVTSGKFTEVDNIWRTDVRYDYDDVTMNPEVSSFLDTAYFLEVGSAADNAIVLSGDEEGPGAGFPPPTSRSRGRKRKRSGEEEKLLQDFMEAAGEGRVIKMHHICSDSSFHDLRMDSTDEMSGETALHKAARGGHVEAVKWILEQFKKEHGGDATKTKAFVLKESVIGKTAWVYAVRSNSPELVELLLETGVDVNMPVKWYGKTSVLHESPNLEIFKLLLKNGANVNARNAGSDYTVLHHSVVVNNMEQTKILLQHKELDVNARTKNGKTALHIFLWFLTVFDETALEILELFTSRVDLEVDLLDNARESPLYILTTLNHPDHNLTPNPFLRRATELLLEKGANPIKVQGSQNSTPLNLAERFTDKSIARLMLRYLDGVEVCNLCRVPFGMQAQEVIKLDCGHLFHHACIVNWATTQSNDEAMVGGIGHLNFSCPQCRVVHPKTQLQGRGRMFLVSLEEKKMAPKKNLALSRLEERLKNAEKDKNEKLISVIKTQIENLQKFLDLDSSDSDSSSDSSDSDSSGRAGPSSAPEITYVYRFSEELKF